MLFPGIEPNTANVPASILSKGIENLPPDNSNIFVLNYVIVYFVKRLIG